MKQLADSKEEIVIWWNRYESFGCNNLSNDYVSTERTWLFPTRNFRLGVYIGYSGLGCHLWHGHPIYWTGGGGGGGQDATHQSTRKRRGRVPKHVGPYHPCRRTGWKPWLLAFVDIWRMNQQIQGFSLCLPFCHSVFEKKKMNNS